MAPAVDNIDTQNRFKDLNDHMLGGLFATLISCNLSIFKDLSGRASTSITFKYAFSNKV